MIGLALEEKLDELDPLRHLRGSQGDDEDIAHIVPDQSASILNQSIELLFPTSNSSSETIDSVEPGLVVIKLAVDASSGCGGIAWPAGKVLSRYIAGRGSLDGTKVLELGSGTGLVGLVAGKLGAEVWITDQAPLLPIMERNVSMNDLFARVHVVELNWGAPLPKDIPAPHLVLAADCVYFEPAFPLLVQTLVMLVPDGNTDVLFCYKKRRKADKRFFTLLKKEFDWTDVTDDPDREVYTREAISLLWLTRKTRTPCGGSQP